VTKEELFDEVWNGAAVEENNLTQSISALRKALGEKRGEKSLHRHRSEPRLPFRRAGVACSRGNRRLGASSRPGTQPARGDWRITPDGRGSGRVDPLPSGCRTARHPPIHRRFACPRFIKNSTEAWLQTALPEMLTSELAAGNKLRTVPTEDVARWRIDAGAAIDNQSQSAFFIPPVPGWG